ncbi:MAG: sulfotransferase [Rhodospirillales bacterium]
MAGLPGNAAGYKFDDVDHVLKVAIGLALGQWLDGRNPSWFVEKTPEHVLNLDLLFRMLPSACVIHVVRDGRDETVSARKFNLGISRGDFLKSFQNFASFAEKFAQAWSQSIGAGKKFGQNNQTRYLEIQSSDITVDPSSIVVALLDFLGVYSTQKIAQNCADMAWDISPLDVEHGVWETTFDDEANRLFLRHSGELMKLLNYD